MILAIDATGSTCSVAILDQATPSPSLARDSYTVIGAQTVNNGQTHSVNLLPMIDQVLTDTNTELSQITTIAVSQGPGSFTGVRIGISTAKALAHKHNTPVIAVPTLDGLACNLLTPTVTPTESLANERLVIPIMDARRSQVYGAIYQVEQVTPTLQRTSDYLSIGIHALITSVSEQAKQIGLSPQDCIFLGDGAPVHQALLLSYGFTVLMGEQSLQQATSIGRLAHLYPRITYQTLEPFYIRKPQAVRELSPVNIEPFDQSMTPTVHQLFSESVADFWSLPVFEADIRTDYSNYAVATKTIDGDQRIVGAIGFHHHVDHIDLMAIAIHPDYRGEAIGERLLHHLHTYAQTHQVATIALEVRESNLIARNFYEKHGYTIDRLRTGYYQNPTENAVIYSRAPRT